MNVGISSSSNQVSQIWERPTFGGLCPRPPVHLRTTHIFRSPPCTTTDRVSEGETSIQLVSEIVVDGFDRNTGINPNHSRQHCSYHIRHQSSNQSINLFVKVQSTKPENTCSEVARLSEERRSLI